MSSPVAPRFLRYAVLLVGFVALAGCASLWGPSPNATTTQTQTTTLAPGLSASGVTDPWALAQAHDETLDNTSYTIRSERVVRVDGEVVRRISTRTLQSRSEQRYLFTRTVVGSNHAGGSAGLINVSVFRNETTWIQRLTFQNGSVEYRRAPNILNLRPRQGFDFLYTLFASVNTTVDSSVSRNGTTLYRVVSTGSPQPTSPYADAANFTMTAYITQRGRVYNVTVSYRTIKDGREVQISQYIEFVDIGSTVVNPPPWLQNTTR